MAAGVDVDGLLQRIHRLELIARDNAAGLTAGDYATTIRGQGMVFRETRKYVRGEPARQIEWNVTARLGEPYVKVHEEERRRDVWLALDVSPSMHLGFQDKTKLEHAVELAATLAVAAIDCGDRVGCLVFADHVLAELPPRGGRRQLFQLLRLLLEHTQPWTRAVPVSDPRVAVHAIERHRRGRFVVFLISDFVDADVPDDLRYFRPRHDVDLLHVYDPIEHLDRDTACPPVRFTGFSPEGDDLSCSAQLGLDAEGRAAYESLRQQAMAARVHLWPCPTDLPVKNTLQRLFHLQQLRAKR